MPDFTVEYYWRCDATFRVEVAGSKGQTYIVTFGEVLGSDVGYDFQCTCPASKFRKGYCKHILSVKDKYCGWQQMVDGGEPVDENGEKLCPKCRGQSVYEGHAV